MIKRRSLMIMIGKFSESNLVKYERNHSFERIINCRNRIITCRNKKQIAVFTKGLFGFLKDIYVPEKDKNDATALKLFLSAIKLFTVNLRSIV
jgi:hypothetical protein